MSVHLVPVVVVLAAALAVSGSLWAASDGGGSTAETLRVDGPVSGRAVALAMGQRLEVRLPSNPSTGYSWSFVETPSQVLKLEGPSTYQANWRTEAVGMVGVGGTEVWTFMAEGAGTQDLCFEYRRLWEVNTVPAEVSSYAVTVR
jgi:inhibitor of cysteine peptidase